MRKQESIIEVDVANESNAAYVSYKERNSSTTKYLDEKRKSFPIRKGHECTDLEAAVKAWGRYKGSLTNRDGDDKYATEQANFALKIVPCVTERVHATGQPY